jgi:outer membrane protein assembly factor BamB
MKSAVSSTLRVTPTAGGLVFFGDMGGNFYAVDAGNGQRLWDQKLEGAIGGGVITYMAHGSKKGGRGSRPDFDRLASRTNYREDRDPAVG